MEHESKVQQSMVIQYDIDLQERLLCLPLRDPSEKLVFTSTGGYSARRSSESEYVWSSDDENIEFLLLVP